MRDLRHGVTFWFGAFPRRIILHPATGNTYARLRIGRILFYFVYFGSMILSSDLPSFFFFVFHSFALWLALLYESDKGGISVCTTAFFL